MFVWLWGGKNQQTATAGVRFSHSGGQFFKPDFTLPSVYTVVMKIGKVFGIGCAVVALLGIIAVCVTGVWLYRASQNSKGLLVSVDAPIGVRVGETFDMKIVVKNERAKGDILVTDIDIEQKYLEGFFVVRVDPKEKDSMNVPLVNSLSHTFDLQIPPGEQRVFTFTLRAVKTGIYRGEVDVCAGTSFTYVTAQAQTMVTEESEGETKEIKDDIIFMMTRFNEGDAQALIDRTHESLFAAAGISKEVLATTLRQAAEEVTKRVKIVEFSAGTPTKLYSAGKYELCFVPTVTIMETQGKKVRATGFMVAVRTTGQSGWKYLDGREFNKNPKLLKKFFPDLDSKAVLPPYKMELL